MLGLTGGSGKLKKTVKRMISRNMRNRDADLMQHINKHTKQSAMEDLIYKTMKNKTQYFLLTQTSRFIRCHL